MPATYTWDVFTTLDGYGSFDEGADWGGYWGKHGPELLASRAAQYAGPQHLVFGATTFRENAGILVAGDDPFTLHEWNQLALRTPTTVVSSALTSTLGWPDATIARGDARDVVARLKQDSTVPLRSQASLSMNRSLLDAGLVDRVQLTVFPVLSGRSGTSPVLRGVGDHDLELLESRTLDGRTLELVYRPTPRPSTP